MKADLYNFDNEKTGTVELPEKVFGARWNPVLVRQAVVAQQANARVPWAHAKDRSEVRGGGRKPWRQKGTGRARHGSTRSPLWSGGGKAHGPLSERDYTQKLNKKMRRAALVSVLSRKLADGQVTVIEGMDVAEPKTRLLSGRLAKFIARPKGKKAFDALLVPSPESKALFRAGRNLVKTKVLSAASLNVYDVMNYRTLLIDRDALEIIAKNHG